MALGTNLNHNLTKVQVPRPHFLDLQLSISAGFGKTKIYDKRDDFDFDF